MGEIEGCAIGENVEGVAIGCVVPMGEVEGCAVLGSAAFKDDSVASGGFVKEGNRGAKTVLVFLRDDSVEDVDTGGVGVTETGGCELGWSGINRLAVPTVTAVMLPKANRVLDIQSFP